MKNKEKQIEEMAKDLKECLPSGWYWQKSVDSDTYCVAKHFYNEGYRKIDKDSVVFSKEEYAELQKLDDKNNETIRELRQEIITLSLELVNSCKETTEKFARDMFKHSGNKGVIMNSEKVKEIKKALELIVNANTPKTKIHYYGNLHLDILTYINELESENERLLNEKWDKEDDLDNYHIENQQLEDRISKLEKKTVEKVLKEFANIKVNGSSLKDYIIAVKVVDKIDEIAKRYGIEIKE